MGGGDAPGDPSSAALGEGKRASGVPGGAGRKNARGPAWALSPPLFPEKRRRGHGLGGCARLVVKKFTGRGVAVYSIS